MSIGAVRFQPAATGARPAKSSTGAGGTTGFGAGGAAGSGAARHGMQPAATAGHSQRQKPASAMDVLRHVFKGINNTIKGAKGQMPKGTQAASQQAPRAASATTQPSDSSLLTYARKDMPKFLVHKPGQAPKAPGPPKHGNQNPFQISTNKGHAAPATGANKGGATTGGQPSKFVTAAGNDTSLFTNFKKYQPSPAGLMRGAGSAGRVKGKSPKPKPMS